MQYLPGSYVNTFPRWSVDFHPDQMKKNHHDVDENEEDTNLYTSSSLRLIPLEGTIPQDDDNSNHQLPQQYVDPTSNQELWWPCDLKTLQMRPSLDFFVKSGIPSLVMAGIQIRVPPEASMDGKEWRNFGRNSQPLASLWTSFQMAVERGFRVETYYGRVVLEGRGGGNGGGVGNGGVEGANARSDSMLEQVLDWKHVKDDDNDENHGQEEKEREIGAVTREKRLFQSVEGTQRAVEWMGRLLANLEDDSPLLEGMHIVSIPVNEEWWDLPELKGEGDGYKLVSIGTVESDARELLKMGNEMMVVSGASLLSVDVSKIAAGGQSNYIPNVYLPLYCSSRQE
jgi:hypothetical protein